MKRLVCLTLVVALANHLPSQAQEKKKDPPKDFTNSIGMKFVWIPPGTFMMGSSKEEEGRSNDECQHKVTFGKTISTGQANYDGDFTYDDGMKGVNRKKTTPVGTFPANVGACTTCTAMFGSGARIGTAINGFVVY